jgi:hypothetical protein
MDERMAWVMAKRCNRGEFEVGWVEGKGCFNDGRCTGALKFNLDSELSS